MDNIACLVCLLVVACLLGLVPAEHREELAKRKPAATSFWFGPRIGRNKRNPFRGDVFVSGSTCEDIEEYIRAIPWDLVRNCIISEGKRDGKSNKSNTYIPRLGRESGEEYLNPTMGDKYYDGGIEFIREVVAPNSPPFSPRLG